MTDKPYCVGIWCAVSSRAQAADDGEISRPILRTIAAHRLVGMVHIDAHTDTRDEELGSKFNTRE